MTKRRNLGVVGVALAAALWATQALAADAVLRSPNGQVVLRVARDGASFSLQRRGEAVLAPSPLGLDLAGEAPLGRLVLEQRRDEVQDRRIPLVATKAASARDHYRGATLSFREQGGERRLLLDLRAYDDGVALRYRMEGSQPVQLAGERTGFVPAGDPSCLVSEAKPSHEVSFERARFSQLRTDKPYDVPLVCATPSGRTHYAIAQAHLEGYTGAALWREGPALRVKLAAPPQRPQPAYVSAAGLRTAWRAVMLADRAGELIESHLIGNLNPAPQPGAYGDFKWVKPGKAAWDWWSGPLAGMKPDMAAYRRFIDFAAEAGLPYYLIDAGWAWASNYNDVWVAKPETDITRPAEGIDVEELVRYGEAKGVGILLWAHWQHVADRMDLVLDTYARWGVKGVKIDFLEREDQEMVAFYQRVAEATAARGLLLDLHGAYVPAGLQRSFPNFITQEGVLGAEWNKMTKQVTPRHNLMLPFTRMLAGPIDYTPGGFRHASPAAFEVRAELPLTQTTRGQALAMYVVYDSPLQMVSDDPSAYRDGAGEAAGFDFIRRVPTAWDETRFLSGEPGEHIVLARRQGRSWYLGAMTSDTAREARLPLRFLGPGRWRATVWQDGATANDVQRSERTVTRAEELSLPLAATGGAVVVLEPLR
ncbi:glycoside hydrolase family 97 protein [Roseateles sp.]|uniref:glycoside hydrolase family 97 protein n=1 Tax=Roseateles sp. TaxID=1971397 RepID=UPI00394B5913